MTDWIATLAGLESSATESVLVTLAAAQGSAPREAGARMVVTAEETFGSIGGGHLEFEATGIARRMLGKPGSVWQRFPLGPALGQCCGGQATLLFENVPRPGAADDWRDALEAISKLSAPAVLATAATRGQISRKMLISLAESVGSIGGELEAAALTKARDMLRQGADLPRLEQLGETASLLFEPLRRQDFDVVIFGAGHVGQALVRVLSDLPCRIRWIDSREDQFPAELPDNVIAEVSDAPEYDVDEAPGGSCFLVMTHSHQLDLVLSERILRRGDFRYFGLIGSRTKRKRFETRLLNRGIAAERLGRMTCPIGIAGISGKRPAEIAIAVAAELLRQREKEQAVSGTVGKDQLFA